MPSTSKITTDTEWDEPAWYCVRTQTKREHLAAKSLKQLEGIETFCPRLRYKKATRRGKIWWIEAMFPGYIFAYFSRTRYERAVVHTQGVIGLLKFGSHIPSIPTTFIAQLVEQMGNQNFNDDILTLQPAVKPGDKVEIAHGAMQGISGKIIEIIPASERVKVLIDFLGNPQLIDIDLFSLLLPEKPTPNQ